MVSVSFINRVKHTKLFYNFYYYIGSLSIRLLKCFLKPNDKLIVFSSYSGRKYDDSPKAIYEAMLTDNRYKDYKIVWAFKHPEMFEIERGEKVKIDTLAYYKTVLKARVWITNVSMNRGLDFTGINTLLLNSWHGSAIKKIGCDLNNDLIESKLKSKRADIMLAQGDYDVKKFSHAYNLPQENVIITGLPRNDELVCANMDERKTIIKQKMGIPANKSVILYAPTYRDYNRDEGKNCIMDLPINLVKWEKMLSPQYVLLIRAHFEICNMMIHNDNNFVRNVSDYPLINDLLIVSDILISDYSSIIFDYSIMGKPIYCYAYDYDTYNKERGLYFDIRKELSSEEFCDENRLIADLSNINYEERELITKRFRSKYVKEYGNASHKTLNVLFDHLWK